MLCRPTIPPATIDEGLEVTGDALAARQFKSRMYVTVQVNGKGPYRFFVDSGADRSVIGAEIARRLDLPPGSPVLMQSVTGGSRVETVMIDSLKIGMKRGRGYSGPRPAGTLSGGADGLLGIDALADQRLMLDFDRKTVTVQDLRRPVESAPGEIVVIARRRTAS